MFVSFYREGIGESFANSWGKRVNSSSGWGFGLGRRLIGGKGEKEGPTLRRSLLLEKGNLPNLYVAKKGGGK